MKTILDNPVIDLTIRNTILVDENGLVRWNKDAISEDYIFLIGKTANGRDGNLILARDPDPSGRSKIVLCGYFWTELEDSDVQACYYANSSHKGFDEFVYFAKQVYKELGIEYNRDNYSDDREFLDEAINDYIWPCVVRALTIKHTLETLTQATQ